MALIFHSSIKRDDWWRAEMAKHVPDLEMRFHPDVGNPDDIEFALCFNMPEGELARFKNLKAIFSLGAGVDHFFKDPTFPKHVPLARVVDDELSARMTEYVVQHVLNHHRDQLTYDHQQRQKVWKVHHPPAATARKVGILGLGALGNHAAKTLASLGFQVSGWSRSKKEIPSVKSYAGAGELDQFLSEVEILVCLLPLTEETEGILNADLFAKLPEGASLINPGRGPHLVEEDLIKALDSGHMSCATLDVFRTEPLPEDSPLWSHEKIRITPHVASIAAPNRVAALVAQNIIRARNGEKLLNQVDVDRGY
ncbi:2-hydroxyacid dehydrogenase [Sneathiella limimaris]|uniref:2-hydroxyacid dehydrogenase n=1 Tax=Sneathiella limimaris TaxID=1964213 RepID=UPI00146A7CDC|nr:glyoxylate/hydroxypyruvate reductase A [Sneathiella limimaris]